MGGRVSKTPTGTPTKGRRAANGATPSRGNGQRNGHAVKEEMVSGESSMVEELNDGVDVDWMAGGSASRSQGSGGAFGHGGCGDDNDEEQGFGRENGNGYPPDLDAHGDAYWEGEMV